MIEHLERGVRTVDRWLRKAPGETADHTYDRGDEYQPLRTPEHLKQVIRTATRRTPCGGNGGCDDHRWRFARLAPWCRFGSEL